MLLGRDHPHTGAVATRAADDDLAIALTRGGHPKRRPGVEPNEDAVAVRRTGGRAVLVVADGHGGAAASHRAVGIALGWDDLTGYRDVVAMVHGLNEDLVRHGSARHPARTTLVVAIADLADPGGPVLRHAAVGDSAALLVRGEETRALTARRPRYLGEPLTEVLVAGALEHGTVTLQWGDVVVLVTDGWCDFADDGALAGIASAADAEAIADGVVRHATACGAGDNVAAAVLRLGREVP